ncbi:MAG TPA: aldo/keto reductase [Acidobacteriaceae bacterium]|nr:aldo/keto reductase [Acidobacteriaceae bacterium]
MKINQLGTSNMWLSPIGFGAWATGGGNWAYSWGPQDDDASIAAIHRALDLGVNWIDTAAVYGLGHSEEVVGRAVKGYHIRPFLFTKCGLIWNEKREITRTTKHIRRECEESLRRLQVETIDLYQIHWPIEGEDMLEAWQTMAALKKEGKVRYIGVSNFSTAEIHRLTDVERVTSLQPPYSMINRSVEAEILPFCREHAIGVINYSPQHSGLLTGAMTKERVAALPPDDFRRNAKNYQEPHLSRNLAIADFLKGIGARHGVSAGVVAIAWTLANPAVTAAIVGARSPEQVEGVWPAAKFRLSRDEMQEIEDYLMAHPAAA